MTPEERFDTLWAIYLGQTFSLEDDARDWLKQAFVAQIREAVEDEQYRLDNYDREQYEADKKELEKCEECDWRLDKIISRCGECPSPWTLTAMSHIHLLHTRRDEVARLAYEDAAKIAEEWPENTYSMDCEHKEIGEAIRARAKEVGNE